MKKPYKTETTHVHKLACFSCEHVRVYPHKKKWNEKYRLLFSYYLYLIRLNLLMHNIPQINQARVHRSLRISSEICATFNHNIIAWR